jgi:DedD protein
MERRLKERLIGASVLVMLAVIFIPMLLDDSEHVETKITGSNIPARPEGDFTSKIVPLPGGDFEKPEAVAGPTMVEAPPAPPAAAPVQQAAPAVAPEPARTTAPQPEAKPTAAQAGATVPERVGLSAWVVQLGSFSSEENATGLERRLRDAGYTSFVEPLRQDGEAAYRVRVGPELLRSEAQALRDRIKSELGLDGIVVSYP